MKIFLTICTILVCLNPIYAKEKTFGNVFIRDITSVYDGDTFRCEIPGFPALIGERIPVRVYGVDTPELRGEDKEAAQKAKEYTVYALRHAQTIELRNMRRGKYFRIVAEVFIDGVNLADLLIANGLGKPYFGGKK